MGLDVSGRRQLAILQEQLREAQSEARREALERQIAALRERLNLTLQPSSSYRPQAPVTVDIGSPGDGNETPVTTSSAVTGQQGGQGAPLVDPIANWRDKVTSGFGMRKNPTGAGHKQHTGLDIGAPGGTPIQAVKDGKVVFAGDAGGFGNLVVIQHASGEFTLYAHQSEINARVGQEVKAGDVIGKVGTTGNSTGNHLHFEVRTGGDTWQNAKPADPIAYLGGSVPVPAADPGPGVSYAGTGGGSGASAGGGGDDGGQVSSVGSTSPSSRSPVSAPPSQPDGNVGKLPSAGAPDMHHSVDIFDRIFQSLLQMTEDQRAQLAKTLKSNPEFMRYAKQRMGAAFDPNNIPPWLMSEFLESRAYAIGAGPEGEAALEALAQLPGPELLQTLAAPDGAANDPGADTTGGDVQASVTELPATAADGEQTEPAGLPADPSAVESPAAA